MAQWLGMSNLAEFWFRYSQSVPLFLDFRQTRPLSFVFVLVFPRMISRYGIAAPKALAAFYH